MRRTPRSRRWTTALVAVAAALGLASSAAAEPRLGGDRGDLRRQLVDLQRQARELDDKIRRIQMELAREARTRGPRPVVPASPAFPAACLLPFYLDSDGIKHLRPECAELVGAPSCDPPYNMDEQGVRHFRPGCATGTLAPGRRAGE